MTCQCCCHSLAKASMRAGGGFYMLRHAGRFKCCTAVMEAILLRARKKGMQE